tara:strand:- start:247 stop:996 length:750 start_codon:yes stop_codon:yes gene_type:complete
MNKLLGNKNKKTTTTNERGFILYDGPSRLTGEPIVIIATIKSNNAKTGNMIQTWILRSDISPVEASKQSKDDAICGNCPHRQNTGGACYVNIGQAPSAVYKAYKKGSYKPFDASAHKELFFGRMIRLGSYGDPAAVPVEVWNNILQYCIGHTGYTHQIKHKNFQKDILKICQVSADTPKQALKLQKQGLKTFRVALPDDGLLDDEIECLSDSKGLSCMACGLCDGSKQNIAIVVHGSRSSRFKSKLIAQ